MVFMKKIIIVFILCAPLFAIAQAGPELVYILQPDRVFDGEHMQEGWQVVIRNSKIEFAGIPDKQPANARIIILRGCTLLPGLIEGHSHLFLHPYNETSWNDQVLKESRAERTARAAIHARATLMAGFTTAVSYTHLRAHETGRN